MYVQVRSIDGKKRTIVSVSKTTKIQDVKNSIAEEFNVPVEKQRLFFRGKQVSCFSLLLHYFVSMFAQSYPLNG